MREKEEILELLRREPGLDDVEIADRLGRIPFEISVLLGELAEAGLVE